MRQRIVNFVSLAFVAWQPIAAVACTNWYCSNGHCVKIPCADRFAPNFRIVAIKISKPQIVSLASQIKTGTRLQIEPSGRSFKLTFTPASSQHMAILIREIEKVQK